MPTNLPIKTSTPSGSIRTRKDTVPQYHNIWHYHEEIEFIYIERGTGTFFIGDCIKSFENGTCVLIGKNIPHYWLFDDKYIASNTPAEVYVMHFREVFSGVEWTNIPEMITIKKMLELAQKGLFITKADSKLINHFKQSIQLVELHRLMTLFLALQDFEQTKDKTTLVSETYSAQHQDDDVKRMNNVLNHINQNFKNKLDLDTIANISGLTKNSFCRYFKQKTGKTLLQFVTELKISHACKLLNKDDNIKKSCFESGFNNFVSFHKAFKKVTGVTPKAFKENKLS